VRQRYGKQGTQPKTRSLPRAGTGPPAWKTIPSWAVIGTADHVIPPAELLFMAHRAHVHITEINAGHESLITNPGTVTRVIIDAADATTG